MDGVEEEWIGGGACAGGEGQDYLMLDTCKEARAHFFARPLVLRPSFSLSPSP